MIYETFFSVYPILCRAYYRGICDDIQTVKDLESRAGWTWSVTDRLSPPAFWKFRPSAVRICSWGGRRRTIRRPVPFFFSWASVEYLIKTVYNWWGVCEWETLFRWGFSYNIEFNNQFQHNIFAVCWIQIKEIDESTIQRPRIWPAFLAFILFPPIGFISFLLYKNTIDHIKYRRHGSSTWMDANIGPDDHIW